MSESRFYHFTATGLHYSVKTFQEILTVSREGGFIWLDYYNPDKAELMKLVDTIGVHPLSVEDCLDNRQIPKIEYFPDNTFILFNAFTYSEGILFIDEINLIIGRNYLITISGHNSDGRRPLKDIPQIIENDPGNVKSGPAFLLHVVLDHLVDQKFHAFDILEDELDVAEDEVLNNPESFQPSELIRLRKSLLNLRKSLFHEREILVKICRLDCPLIRENVVVHYRDLYDHLTKFFELTETYREIVNSLLELYTSLINNLMTKAANETNASVRRLTLIATIFMPLTLIAGIGGMSEWTMITGPTNWKIAYPLFILGMMIIAVINYILIKGIEKGRFSRKRTG